MAYLYRHIRQDKNQPFYIGIGSDNNYARANDIKPKRRNSIWNSIFKKTEIEIEIVLDNLTWQEACKKEIEFIKLYGRLDLSTGILSNLTNGGDGTLGFSLTEERKKILSLRFSGQGNPMYGKKMSQESIEKASLKKRGKSSWNKGLKNIYSDECLKKMSLSKKGTLAWNKGLKNVNGKGQAKLVLDLNSGVYFESAKEASIAIEMKHSTLKSKLNGSNKNNTSLIYV